MDEELDLLQPQNDLHDTIGRRRHAASQRLCVGEHMLEHHTNVALQGLCETIAERKCPGLTAGVRVGKRGFRHAWV